MSDDFVEKAVEAQTRVARGAAASLQLPGIEHMVEERERILRELRAPFTPDEMHWRVGSTSKDKTKGLALAYIDARNVMNRLDAVVGPENWSDEYQQGPEGIVFCRLSIIIPGAGLVSKMDGAGKSDIEADKGAVSGALKRAAVKWGIGRYLYELQAPWVEIEQRGRSYTIKKSEFPKLARVLQGAVVEEPQEAEEPLDQIVKKLMTWAEANGVGLELVATFVKRDVPHWTDLTRTEVDAIREQAKLVQGGMDPATAFGKSEEESASHLQGRIDSLGEPGLRFDAPVEPGTAHNDDVRSLGAEVGPEAGSDDGPVSTPEDLGDPTVSCTATAGCMLGAGHGGDCEVES